MKKRFVEFFVARAFKMFFSKVKVKLQLVFV